MLALALIVVMLSRLGVRAQLTQPVTGSSGMIEQYGEAIGPIGASTVGKVLTHGEIWSAISREDILKGDRVRVVAVDGMQLTVRRATSQNGGSDT